MREQNDLARETGMTQSAVARLEAGMIEHGPDVTAP
jgi:predicted transcriptional regulator